MPSSFSFTQLTFFFAFAIALFAMAPCHAATIRIGKDNILPTPGDRRRSARRVKTYLRSQGTPPSHLLPSPSSSTRRPSIVGGYDAGNDTVPYLAIVDVYLPTGPGAVCTGTIISRDRVLTAAHCFLDDDSVLTNLSSVFIWAGVRDLSDLNSDSYPLFYRAYTAHVDARYDGDGLNWDVGIVTLATYFPDGYPAAMVSGTGLKNKQKVYAAGYGVVNEETEELPQVVQEVGLKARRYKKCIKNEDNLLKPFIVKRTMQCASALKFKKGGQDTCLGDSGGPLFMKMQMNDTMGMDAGNGTKMVVYGVTSFGSGCAGPKSGAWYMKTSFFYDNIQDHVALGDDAMMADADQWKLVYDDSASSPFL